MNDKPERRKRPRTRRTYKHHKSALCVSVYDPTGATVPIAVRREIEDVIWGIAQNHRLLITIADE